MIWGENPTIFGNIHLVSSTPGPYLQNSNSRSQQKKPPKTGGPNLNSVKTPLSPPGKKSGPTKLSNDTIPRGQGHARSATEPVVLRDNQRRRSHLPLLSRHLNHCGRRKSMGGQLLKWWVSVSLTKNPWVCFPTKNDQHLGCELGKPKI